MTKRSRDELEFLPAALEVLETPPPRSSRVLGWSIVALCAACITWATAGEVDTVVVATGQLVPDGRTKPVQASVTAAVTSVAVADGDRVVAGQALLELDATNVSSELAALARANNAARLQLARVAAMLRVIDNDDAFLNGVDDVPEPLKQATLAQLRSQAQQFQMTRLTRSTELERAQARHQTSQSQLAKTSALLPLSTERERALSALLDRGAVARPQWLAAREQWLSLSHDQQIQSQQLSASGKDVKVAINAWQRHRTDARAQLLGEKISLADRLDNIRLQLSRNQALLTQYTVRAPVDGIVHDVKIVAVGNVAATGAQLMRIVPDGAALLAEAWLDNNDIGFISPEHEVAIKLSGFPFTRYGALTGRIIHLSADTANDREHGARFVLRASLDREHMLVNGTAVALTSGMQLTLDVKTGKRRIIDYLLEPITRGFQEVLRER